MWRHGVSFRILACDARILEVLHARVELSVLQQARHTYSRITEINAGWNRNHIGNFRGVISVY
jgi:hypothetical protein